MSVQIKGSGTIGGIDEGLVISGIITTTSFVEHAGDSNTKFGFEGPDTITFETAGSERLRINSDGKVGLGTTGSEYGLSIREADNNNKWLMLQKNSGQELLQIREDGDNHVIIDGSHASGELHFYTAGTEKFRIDTTGNIIVKGDGHEVRWLRDAGDRYGAIKYDGGQFSIMNPVNDNTQVTKSDGTLHTRFNNGGNLEIANGNLVISNAGSGIDFSATNDGSGTSNRSEVLDDYEEGSFTPIMSVEGQGSNASLSVARGLYNKVGSMVNIWIEVQFNGTPSGRSTSNAWQFGGLPFTSQLYNDSPSGLRDYRFPMIAMSLDTSSTYGSNGHFVFRLFDNNTYGRIEWQHSDLSLKNASLFIQDTTMIQIHACYPDF
jgi:hypothetical protein